MGFLDQLLEAINQEQQARAFGPDWQMKERKARLEERQAELDSAFRRAQTMKATRDWDAKLRAAQQLYPDLAPEEALAKSESEDIDLGRQTKRAIIGLREAQATKAQQPPPKRFDRFTTDEGVFREDLDTGERTRLGDRPRSIRTTGDVSPNAPLGTPFELDVGGEKKVFFRTKGGVVSAEQVIPGATGLGRTAEQRNIEYHGAAMEPAFATVDTALQGLEEASKGAMGALPSAIPGTDAYWARRQYQDLAQNLLSTIVARQAGEGSRLSDQDRAAYAQAISIVRSTILLPGGVAQARKRLDLARNLLMEIDARRKGSVMSGPSGEPDFGDVQGEGSTGAVDIDYYDLFPEEQEAQ